MLDLLLVLLALAAMALVIFPYLTRSRVKSNKLGCSNYLKQGGLALRSCSMDLGFGDKFPMQVSVTNGGAMELAQQGSVYSVFLAASNDFVTPKLLFCPNDSTPLRRQATDWTPTLPPGSPPGRFPFTTNSISYFIGMDASADLPATFLMGDDHFTMGRTKPKPGLWLLPTNTPVEWRKERHSPWGNVAFADGSVQSLDTRALRTALVNTGMATNRLILP
jgi:prepilin-type processing-associated H-X9-DG protein